MIEFSIITPTVQRESLLKCCESIDQQSLTDRWQHIVVVDSLEINHEMMGKIQHPNRLIVHCVKPHRNTGNTCRHNGWRYATGEWVAHIDDDNFVASPRVLETLAETLQDMGDAQWALFPIVRHGHLFYHDPPKPCFFDTGNAVCKREIAQWPDIDDYASDAVWLTDTLLKYPYKAFPEAQPIMVMPGTSFGAGGGMHGQ